MSTSVYVFLLAVLIVLSGCLSASETSLFSLSTMTVKSCRLSKDPRDRLIASLLKTPRMLLVSIIMCNVIVNILAQNVVSSLFGGYASWVVTVGVPLGLTLIFGEVIPKSLAISKNRKIAYAVAPSLTVIKQIVSPIRSIVTFVTTGVVRTLFFFLRKEEDISLDELKHALKASHKVGLLSTEESKIAIGYLNLEEDLVKEVMSHRQDIFYYDIHEPLEKLVALFVDKELTRIPVCDGNLDKVLGVIQAGQFFSYQAKIKKGEDLLHILRKPQFVPESMPGKKCLHECYRKGEEFLFAVDEYGAISGVVTIEDLVEVIVGQIADKHDKEKLYNWASDNVLIADGKLEIMQFEEIFDTTLDSPNNMVTIGGYLTEAMGDIPKNGDRYETGRFVFHVILADKKQVGRVYIRDLKARGGKKA